MAKEYLSEHRVQQMFSSLLSALMLHRPSDPVAFIQHTLDEVSESSDTPGFVLLGYLTLAFSAAYSRTRLCVSRY